MRYVFFRLAAAVSTLGICACHTSLDTGPAEGDSSVDAAEPADAAGLDAPLDADQDASAAEDAAALVCPQDEPAGPDFTFHLHNAAPFTVSVDFGYFGEGSPFVFDTRSGQLGAEPGDAVECGTTCDEILNIHPICTDGGWFTVDIPPGETRDLVWDRRVWESVVVDMACFSEPLRSKYTWEAGAMPPCARGQRLTEGVLTGTLAACTFRPTMTCLQGYETLLPIEVDLSTDEVTIELPGTLPPPPPF